MHFPTFYMLLIHIFPFSSDKHLKLIEGSQLFFAFENSLLLYFTFSDILKQSSEILVNFIGTLLKNQLSKWVTCKMSQNVR